MSVLRPQLEDLKFLMETRFPDHDFKWKIIHSMSIMGVCPFHHDSRPSFGLFMRGGKALYNCFACGKHGSADEFRSDDNRPVNVITNSLFQTFLDMTNPDKNIKTLEVEGYYPITKEPYYAHPEVKFYIEEVRGIRPEIAKFWGLRAGEDEYGNLQVIIPDKIIGSDRHYDYTPYYQIRWINFKKFYLPTQSEKTLMHLNSFKRTSLTLVEGPFDALKVGDAVPLFGKALTSYQQFQLESYLMANPQIRDLFIILDGGKPEFEAEMKIFHQIVHYIPSILTHSRIFVGLLPFGSDPGEMGRNVYKYVSQVYPNINCSRL